MENPKVLNKNLFIFFAGFFAFLLRVIPHIPNFTPVGGLSLFLGSRVGFFQGSIVLSLVMIISDFFIGFHSKMMWVYGSFIISVFLGSFLRKKTSPIALFFMSFFSSFIFYLITNFGVWFEGILYPKTLSGLLNSYIMGIPFYKNAIIGDILFSFFYFYFFEYLYNLFSELALKFKRIVLQSLFYFCKK